MGKGIEPMDAERVVYDLHLIAASLLLCIADCSLTRDSGSLCEDIFPRKV
jgi:hypothetical protein